MRTSVWKRCKREHEEAVALLNEQREQDKVEAKQQLEDALAAHQDETTVDPVNDSESADAADALESPSLGTSLVSGIAGAAGIASSSLSFEKAADATDETSVDVEPTATETEQAVEEPESSVAEDAIDHSGGTSESSLSEATGSGESQWRFEGPAGCRRTCFGQLEPRTARANAS